MMHKRSIGLAGSAAVAVLFLASDVSATEPTNYSGAFCFSQTPGMTAFITPQGFMENVNAPSAIEMQAICPATKKANTDVASGFIIVKDQNNGAGVANSVNCSFFSMFAHGSGFDYFITSAPPTIGTLPDWRTLTFGPTGSGPTDAYFYSCNIPGPVVNAHSGIAVYQVNEN